MTHINETRKLASATIQISGLREDRYVMLLYVHPDYSYLSLVPKFKYIGELPKISDVRIPDDVTFLRVGEVLAMHTEGKNTMVRVPRIIVPYLMDDADLLIRIVMSRTDCLEIWRAYDYEKMQRVESLDDVLKSLKPEYVIYPTL